MSALSTIVPVLNDDDALRRCLSALQGCARADQNEIIVADGGASDAARSIASEFAASYLRSERGRARQMNNAAKLARGEWLWFLHADCIPAPDSIVALLSLDTRAAWGCFRHRIDAPSALLRIIEGMDTLRAKLASLPYGDQGIFVRRSTFGSIGNYEDIPLLEDVQLARRLARYGAPRVLRPVLRCDARRWLRNGILNTTLTNWGIMARFLTGMRTPEELARVYQR